ncbi:transcription factor mef2A [Bactrocera oleae]|uniref:transcription factor mef2A n=1 Tax=Bactrocera oleae TaxID=104688 RepID=UPI0006B7514C|nr:neurogenic protein mastermind [Bactrocera oleae]XP_036222424.1 neurogenic protein mastermind [Bactrocera oleae]
MANPRKFSEKIALQIQRQKEGTAEFERIMKEVYATKMDETQANEKILECCLVNTDIGSNHATNASLVSGAGIGGGGSGGGGGGGGVVNTADGGGAGNSAGAANTTNSGSGGTSPDGTHNNNSRESRGRSVGVGPMRRPSERKQDRSPYGSSAAVATGMNAGMTNNAYLSPPMDSSWRRSNSDSALHQTLNMAVAAEGGFGTSGAMSGMGDMNALHANYQHHNQRSHSPNIGRSFSPQAQRRKGQMLHHQQQQQQQQILHHSQQHLHLQQQHQQLQQHFQQHQQQQHMHQQQAQQQHVQQHHAQQPASSISQQQHQQQFNAKYTNCNMPINSLFKSLQEQTLALANTGSLPDLTSLHYSPAQQQLMHQQQQQQQTLSPILSPHNNGRERDQSSSPFSPAGGNGNGVGGGPPSPYQQQQHSPTSAANTPTAAQTSPHLSFTNLAVQSPTGNGSNTQNTAQTGTFTNLPTLGAASSTGNLTEYRQPLNPPSPGSSPGLLTSASGNDVVHISAPASPIRHPQAGMIGSSMQAYNEKNMQAFDRYSPALAGAAPENAGFNSLNSSFHNHFEQFTLGDSNSSPEQQQQLQQHFQQQRQQQQQQNNFTSLDFDVFVSGGNDSPYSQSLTQSKQLDFSDLTGESSSAATTTTQSSRGGTCNTNNGGNTSNNNNTHQGTRILPHQMLNNNGGGAGNTANSNATTNGPCRISNNNVNLTQANEVNSSPIPSPLGCLPSPSSPLPIPINAQSPHHQQQQLSLSLHSHSTQPSPHHSPLHSPHHASPLSSSSPGITTLTGVTTPHVGGNGTNNASTHHNQLQQTTQHHHQAQQQQHHQHHHHQQHHHHHQQNHANTPTNTNIPAIIFSDYSSREIFDSLDLDLSQMDETALDLLADQNSIMIADPTIEDSFRKDLN